MANLGGNLVVLEICRKIFLYVPGKRQGFFLKIILVTEWILYLCLCLFCFAKTLLLPKNLC